MRSAHPARMEPAGIGFGVGHAPARQSTMSMKTRWPCRDRRALDDGAQRGGRPPATADHVAVIVLSDGELEDDASVVLTHLLDLDLVRLVHEPPSQILEEIAGRGGVVAQPVMPCVRRSFLTVSVGWAPRASQSLTLASSSTMVDGSVCAL